MVASTCVRCSNTSFEMVANVPKDSMRQLFFVQCSKCGGVVGVQEHGNITTLIIEQNKAIEEIARKIGVSVKLTTR